MRGAACGAHGVMRARRPSGAVEGLGFWREARFGFKASAGVACARRFAKIPWICAAVSTAIHQQVAKVSPVHKGFLKEIGDSLEVGQQGSIRWKPRYSWATVSLGEGFS